MNQCSVPEKSARRTHATQNVDIPLMITELRNAQVFDSVPGRQYENFRNFRNLFSRVKVTELHKWLTHQKERLSYETIWSYLTMFMTCTFCNKNLYDDDILQIIAILRLYVLQWKYKVVLAFKRTAFTVKNILLKFTCSLLCISVACWNELIGKCCIVFSSIIQNQMVVKVITLPEAVMVTNIAHFICVTVKYMQSKSTYFAYLSTFWLTFTLKYYN